MRPSARRGEHGEALRLAEQALEVRKGTGREGLALIALAEARLAAGDATGSESAAGAALSLAVRQGTRLDEAWARLRRAKALAALGCAAEAVVERGKALKLFEGFGGPALAAAAARE